MNKVIIILLVLLFLCCKDKNKKQDKLVLPEELSSVTGKIGLNDDFAKIMRCWMKEVETSLDTVWNDKKYYTIEFFQKKWLHHDLGNDTLVVISYYSTTKDYLGYKGVLEFNKRNIAIFDKDSIGTVYYDEKKLKYVPLECFTSGELFKSKLYIYTYVLKNGILERKSRF